MSVQVPQEERAGRRARPRPVVLLLGALNDTGEVNQPHAERAEELGERAKRRDAPAALVGGERRPRDVGAFGEDVLPQTSALAQEPQRRADSTKPPVQDSFSCGEAR